MKLQIPFILVVLLIIFQLCSSTLLAGAMFYYLMGNYITREVFPNIVNSAFKSVVQQQNQAYASPSKLNADTADPVANQDAVAEIVKIGKVLGINRRLDNYMKDLWPELDCSLKTCDEKTPSKQKKAKPSESESEEDESDDEVFANVKVTSEEVSNYLIKEEEDVEKLAEMELAEEDPDSFYYSMKDQHKKTLQKKSRFEDEDNLDEVGEYFHREQLPDSSERLPFAFHAPIIFSNLPRPRYGSLPIFIRHRARLPRRNFNYGYMGQYQPSWGPY